MSQTERPKKVIIFGGTGFTGLSVTEAAIEAGLEVTVFVRSTSLPEELANKV